MTRHRAPPRPAKRELTALTAFYAGETDPSYYRAPEKRGRQPEGYVNDEIAAARHDIGGLMLERNKRRLATPPGMSAPIMLGWLASGSSDWVGHYSLVVTPAMVGKRIAVPVYAEAKTGLGTLSDDQQKFHDAAVDAGAIAGVVRQGVDLKALIEVWYERIIR